MNSVISNNLQKHVTGQLHIMYGIPIQLIYHVDLAAGLLNKLLKLKRTNTCDRDDNVTKMCPRFIKAKSIFLWTPSIFCKKVNKLVLNKLSMLRLFDTLNVISDLYNTPTIMIMFESNNRLKKCSIQSNPNDNTNENQVSPLRLMNARMNNATSV